METWLYVSLHMQVSVCLCETGSVCVCVGVWKREGVCEGELWSQKGINQKVK